jgi:hypothetical protein
MLAHEGRAGGHFVLPARTRRAHTSALVWARRDECTQSRRRSFSMASPSLPSTSPAEKRNEPAETPRSRQGKVITSPWRSVMEVDAAMCGAPYLEKNR